MWSRPHPMGPTSLFVSCEQTIYHYFRAWRIDGTWEHLNATLRERERTRQGRNPQPSGCIMDSQSAKTISTNIR